MSRATNRFATALLALMVLAFSFRSFFCQLYKRLTPLKGPRLLFEEASAGERGRKWLPYFFKHNLGRQVLIDRPKNFVVVISPQVSIRTFDTTSRTPDSVTIRTTHGLTTVHAKADALVCICRDGTQWSTSMPSEAARRIDDWRGDARSQDFARSIAEELDARAVQELRERVDAGAH
ncbi:MAG: hypothetical protein U1A27_03670 [Phycisphaerae bacterium]